MTLLSSSCSRSENLLNGIDRLVDQILAAKSDSFSDRITAEIDKYLGIKKAEELAPGTELSPEETAPVVTMNSTASNSSEMKALSSAKSVEPAHSFSATPVSHGNFKSANQAQVKINDKKGTDQNFKKQQNDNAPKPQRSSLGQNKGVIEPSQPSQMLPPELSGNTKQNQNKKDSLVSQAADSSACKIKGTTEGGAGSLKLGKENEASKLKRDAEKGLLLKTVKNMNSPNPGHMDSKQDNVAHAEGVRTEAHGNKVQPSCEMRTKNELPAKTEKVTRMLGNKSTVENASSRVNLEESEKESDSISGQKCSLPSETAGACETKLCGKMQEMKDVKSGNAVDTVDDIDAHSNGTACQKKYKCAEDGKEQLSSSISVVAVETKNEAEDDGNRGLTVDSVADTTNQSLDTERTVENREKRETEDMAGNAKKLSNVNKELTDDMSEEMDVSKGNEVQIDEDVEKSRVLKAGSDENLGKNRLAGGDVTDSTTKERLDSRKEADELHNINSGNCSKAKVLPHEDALNTDEKCEIKETDSDTVSSEISLKGMCELDNSTNNTDVSSLDSQLGVGQRRVKRRKRLISEDEEKQGSKSAKVEESDGNQMIEDSKLPMSIEDLKSKKGRGRPRKSGSVKSESQHSSDNELPGDEYSGTGLNRTEPGRGKYKTQEEPVESCSLKRQRSAGSESNTSDTYAEDRDIETNRRTRRQIKPKRCYSPSDGK